MDHPLDDEGGSEQKLRYAPVYREDRSREFAVAFELKTPLKPDGLVTLKFMAIFETSEEISEEFRQSHFPKVNAAAVAYPYLRAFVSQFAVLCGFERCTLPVRNFIKEPSGELDRPKPAQD